MAAKKKSRRPLSMSQIKKGTKKGMAEIAKAHKKLELAIKKHKRHLTSMFAFDVN
jgi:hypothetical protein